MGITLLSLKKGEVQQKVKAKMKEIKEAQALPKIKAGDKVEEVFSIQEISTVTLVPTALFAKNQITKVKISVLNAKDANFQITLKEIVGTRIKIR
ncbi:hypothetical protein LguiB_009160 [Lonicera macranthoides]